MRETVGHRDTAHLTSPRFKSLIQEIFVYFDCVQLAIGGRGHVTQHMRGSTTVHNQNKTTLGKARQIQNCLNRGVQVIIGIYGSVHFDIKSHKFGIFLRKKVKSIFLRMPLFHNSFYI